MGVDRICDLGVQSGAMRDRLEVTLTYSGKDVDDGSMSIEDLVPVLQGFASAYGKIAAAKNISTQHKLRLVGIRKGSAVIALEIWKTIGDNAPQLQSCGELIGAAATVVSAIIAVIQIKKRTRKQPHATRINAATGSIVVIDSSNVSLSVPLEHYGFFKDGIIDNDLAKIVKPLETGRIDSSTIELASTDTPEPLRETILASEKAYFETDQPPATSTKEVWLTGRINTMTKSTNSGYAILTDGTRVYFKLVCPSPERFYGLFGHPGMVKIYCVAHLDENLKPTQLDVSEIMPLQIELFADSDTELDAATA